MRMGNITNLAFPVTPSEAPDSDYEVANKKYVDDNAGGGGTATTYTDSQLITTSQDGDTLYMNAADKTFTLPSVGESDDGMEVTLVQLVSGLSIVPSDSDTILTSGAGQGIESLEAGYAAITLKYIHASTRWMAVKKAGIWKLKGLKLFCDFNGAYQVGQYIAQAIDRAGLHPFAAYGTNIVSGGAYGRLVLNGTDDFANTSDSADFDIMANKDADVTVLFKVKTDNATLATSQVFISQYEDTDNYWYCKKISNTTNTFQFRVRSGASDFVNIQTAAHADTNEHTVAIVRKGSTNIIGVYVDGTQEAHFTMDAGDQDTFAGNLYLGQRGAGDEWLDGYLDDVMLIYGNPFNANPNTTPDDTITIPSTLQMVF